ncbi:MAG: succinylglutamate desuccinylase/aspartoacylase family protein [Clostridia bacterium]|nr:succinylglutamate desuccinylase/aspartoacylase family protein [Clostridia bacterium]
MKNKHLITAVISLAASIAVMIVSGLNYMAAREVPMPVQTENVAEVRMLSEWFDGLKGTHGDTPVYVLKGEKEGGSMLILGGTHANEPSGYMAATTFIETAKVETGTVYVIPYTNYSSMTHNDPGEGNHQFFTIETQSGERTFRFGSRATNPVDQWPDPDVYVHYPSGQQLSGSETRNINRAYPGREDGNLTEKMAYGVAQLINTEGVDITFDLHEASPEYPVINATVAHQDAMDLASDGCINILASGIEMALEQSPTNFHGLTHRELGDFTDTYALLMETANASQGRLRGATTQEQILGGDDDCYLYSKDLGMLYVPWDETGHPIEERCGRHLQGIFEYSQAYNRVHPEAMVEYSNVPGYAELFLDAPAEDLGGKQLGKFLK